MAFISSEHKKKMYKSERMAIIAVLLIVVIIVAVIGFGAIDKKTPTPSDDASNASGNNQSADAVSSKDFGKESNDDSDVTSLPSVVEQPITFVSVKIDNTELTKGDLVLVNKDCEYTVADPKSDLVNVYDEFSTKYFMYTDTDLYLKKEVAQKLCEMCEEFTKETTLTGILLRSAYISREEQQEYYDALSDANKSYAQMGGFSEHHTGLGFDLMAYGSGFTMGENQYAWFNENSWKFGFVLRYPRDKEGVTFVKDDTDHFRYVGIPHALYMYRYSLVLEEYIGYLKGITYEAPLSLGDGGATKYQAYACKASNGSQTEIMVPAENSGWTYSISGTNDGYFIVTLVKE